MRTNTILKKNLFPSFQISNSKQHQRPQYQILNRTGFVGELIFWETIPMTKLKYTPEIRERAVQLLIESEKDYPSNWAAITAIAPWAVYCARVVLLKHYVPGIKSIWINRIQSKYSSFQTKNVSNNSNAKIKNCNAPMRFYVKQPLFSPRRSSTAHTNNGGFYP